MKKWHYVIAGISIMIIILGISGVMIYRGLHQQKIDTSNNLIHVTYPNPGDIISSPVTLVGEARGNWYFEASFPVTIVDWDGLIIGQGHAEAQSDWMTTEYVPFKATLEFTRPAISDFDKAYANRGAVIFKNDNPSGDPSKDASIEVPVLFK